MQQRKESTTVGTKIIIIAFMIVIVYNLGAGLYYMMTDKGQSNRTVKALTWRIGLSVALILLIILGIATGVIKPHGIGR
ncbi:MAG TPA: twin transmembrane helix small protein [Rudaea sp.]|nr:twin transmembrane helix small protein [Rudaea sp.]